MARQNYIPVQRVPVGNPILGPCGRLVVGLTSTVERNPVGNPIYGPCGEKVVGMTNVGPFGGAPPVGPVCPCTPPWQGPICTTSCPACCQSGATVIPTPDIPQSPKGDGGASNLSCIMNAIGKWGLTFTSVLTGKPVQYGPGGQPIGAQNRFSGNTLILIFVFAGIIIFVATRK